MSLSKRLCLSLFLALFVVLWSVMFKRIGGELLSLPGIVFEGWVNVLIILVTDNPYTGFFNRWMYFNFVFYFCLFYFLISSLSKFQRIARHWRK